MTHAWLWRDGVTHDLGTLPGQELSFAATVNEIGQIVGLSSYISSFRSPYRAEMWELLP